MCVHVPFSMIANQERVSTWLTLARVANIRMQSDGEVGNGDDTNSVCCIIDTVSQCVALHAYDVLVCIVTI